MDVREAPCAQTSLLDVLQQLGYDAWRLFTTHILDNYALKPARLVCKAFRDVLDICIDRVVLELGEDDLQQYRAGARQQLPLWRWTALTKMVIRVDNTRPDSDSDVTDDSSDTEELDPAVLALPFVGQPTACLGRITCLHVNSMAVAVPAAALALVLHCLPNLRHVGVRLWDYDLYGQQIIYSALASLPYLERLEITACSNLSLVGTLADRLLELKVFCMGAAAAVLGRSVGSLAQLSKLTKLHILSLYAIEDNEAADRLGLLTLFNSLPASLQVLELHDCGAVDTREHLNVDALFTGGHISTLELSGELTWSAFSSFARDVLLRSRAVGPQPPQVKLNRLIVDSWMEFWRPKAEQQQLQLLQRFAGVQAATVCFPMEDFPSEAVRDVYAALGARETLELMCDCGVLRVRFRRGAPATGGPSQPVGAPALIPQLPRLPTASEVIDLALLRMAQHAAEGTPTLMRYDGRVYGKRAHVVMLRGPPVAFLAWSGHALDQWMMKLALRAEAAAEWPEGGFSDAEEEQDVVAFLYVPPAAAVLVHCRTAMGAAAVVETAKAMAAADPSVRYGPLAAPDEPIRLEVSLLATKGLVYKDIMRADVGDFLLHGVSQVVQELCDLYCGGKAAGDGATTAVGEAVFMRWLTLELCRELQKLPRRDKLQL